MSKQITPEQFSKLHDYYLAHPDEFVADVLGDNPWDVQIDIIRSTFHYKLTAVKTCNAIGKSFIAARIVITYLMLYPGSIVVTTAPTWRQVTDVLWREVGTALKRAKFKLTDKEATQAGLNLDTDWYAVGVSTKRPENFFGYHADHILVVVDEAGGVEEPIFKGVAAITPNVNARVLLIGNPTNAGGTFYDAFTKPELGYNCFTVSAFDSPNFTAAGIRNVDDLLTLYTPRGEIEQAEWTRRVNAALDEKLNSTYGSLIHPSVVYGRYHEWGTDSPAWQSLIMGEFPSQAEQALFPVDLVTQAMNMQGIDKDTGKTYAELSGWAIPDGPPSYGQDMARYGGDMSVNIHRHGGWVEMPVSWSKTSLMDSADRILNIIDPLDPSVRVSIDDTGNGCLTADTMLLTPAGWVPARDLSPGQKIYSKNLKGQVTIEKVMGNTTKNNDVLEVGGYKFSWGHILPYRTRLSNGMQLDYWDEVIKRKQIIFDSGLDYRARKKDFVLRGHSIRMPNGGVKTIRDKQKIDALLFAEFLGWYVSEGCIGIKDKSITISQKKNEYFDRIVELCSIFGKPQVKRANRDDVYNVVVFNAPLHAWLVKNCYSGGRGAKNKSVPRFIANNHKGVIDAFLLAFNMGDGYIHHGERYYCTSSKVLAYDLIELIHKIGKKSGLYTKQYAWSEGTIHNRKIVRKSDNFVVFECKNGKRGNFYGASTSKGQKHTVEQVQSITITGETHLFYTLVPGAKPIWTHNGGTTDRLMQIRGTLAETGAPSHQYHLAAYNFSSKEFMTDAEREKFHDITSMLYWNLRTWFYKHKIALPKHQRLYDELVGRRWWLNKSGKIQVESKDEYKKRTGGKSPDFSDALALAFADGARPFRPRPEPHEIAEIETQTGYAPLTSGLNVRM